MQVFALPFSPWQQQYKANNNIEKKYMDMDGRIHTLVHSSYNIYFKTQRKISRSVFTCQRFIARGRVIGERSKSKEDCLAFVFKKYSRRLSTRKTRRSVKCDPAYVAAQTDHN